MCYLFYLGADYMALDMESAKIYKKVVMAKSPYEAFTIVERLEPNVAKRILMSMVLNQSKDNNQTN